MTEKKKWFLLNDDGLIYTLSEKHEDWNSAIVEVDSCGLNPVWVVDEYEAKNWAEFIMEELKNGV